MTAGPSSDVAFTPAVKAVQARRGSRDAYARQEAAGSWARTITPDLAADLGAATSLFLATASAAGQPYVQHRGGPPGFLCVLGPRTISFADFAGNRQYITTGNLTENPRALLFLIDYARPARVKIWGEARVVEDDPALVARLMPPGYRARADQAILFTLTAWDRNCPQYIPQRFAAGDVAAALAARDARIRALEAEIARLRGS